MAQVDFSNANIEIVEGAQAPMQYIYFALLHYNYAGASGNTMDLSDITTPTTRVGHATLSIIKDTPSKLSIAYSGTFLASGNGFLIAARVNSSSYVRIWKVTNISFETNDTFSFAIDVDVTGS